MKKVFAILMILALVVSAIPVFAEDAAGTDAATSATVAAGKGGRNNGRDSRQTPAMPGRGQNGRKGMPGSAQNVPAMPDNSQGSQDSQQQAPVMPDNSQAAPDTESTPDTQQAAASAKGQKGRNTQKQVRAGKNSLTKKTAAWLDQLLADGVITQEIHDAIVSYLEAQQSQTAAAEPTALPDSTVRAEGTEPPVAPEGEAPDSPEALLLKQLLDSGVITQEQYDALLPSFSAPAPAESNG